MTESHTLREVQDDEDRRFFDGLNKWNDYELETMSSYFTSTTERIQKLKLESDELNDILYHMYVRKGMIDTELSSRRKNENSINQA